MPNSDDDDNISRTPSTTLFFDEEDSSSETENSGDGPRRRCSFVSNSDRPIMDLRYPASISGDKSYDLSVCSDNSFSTIQTGDDALAKMGMFEAALSVSAGYKKKDDEGVLLRANSYPDGAKVGWLNKFRMRRHTLDHSGVFHHSSVLRTDSCDDDDSCVVKKSNTSRKKAYVRRFVQAAAIILLLSTLTASIILFETFERDHTSFLAAEISRIMAHFFGLTSVREVDEVEQQKEGERVMVQQLQTAVHEEPPVDSHEYDQFFVQAFRNNQKISQRLNKDPMRQRMTLKSGTNVDHVDKVAQIRIQEFLDNQKLAREGTHVTRRRMDESDSEEPTNEESNSMAKRELMEGLEEDLDLTMEWFLQIQYQQHRGRGDNAGGLRKK